MARFVISPHFRLQEWVAEEKGYFTEEGLDYEFHEAIGTRDAKRQNLGDRVGAYQTIERGRSCDVSAACHWTINVAASAGQDRKSTRLNSSHLGISYAVFCLKKKKTKYTT